MNRRENTIALQSGYLDLKSLAVYASCSVRWLRAHLSDSNHSFPHYRVGGKILVKAEEFDRWMGRYRVCPQPDELDHIVDEVIAQVCTQEI